MRLVLPKFNSKFFVYSVAVETRNSPPPVSSSLPRRRESRSHGNAGGAPVDSRLRGNDEWDGIFGFSSAPSIIPKKSKVYAAFALAAYFRNAKVGGSTPLVGTIFLNRLSYEYPVHHL